MPGECIPRVIEGAKCALDQWIEGQMCLCDLQRATFPSFPYQDAHCRAIYQLRYFPAYYAENYLLFERLRQYNPGNLHISSIGCGCFVDAAAAVDVFGGGIVYDGFDLNDWENKAIQVAGNIRFYNRSVFEFTSFSPCSNIYMFSRSIGDLAGHFYNFEDIVGATRIEPNNVFLCATYQLNDEGIGPLRNLLRQFADYFVDFDVAENGTLFHPAADGTPNYGFARGRTWLRHPDRDYLSNLAQRCRVRPAGCSVDGCNVARNPILNVHHLAFEILPLVRRA